MSGRILLEIQPLVVAPEKIAGLPILVVHGALDTVVPIGCFFVAERLLRQGESAKSLHCPVYGARLPVSHSSRRGNAGRCTPTGVRGLRQPHLAAHTFHLLR